MRAFLILLCAVVTAAAADFYVRSTDHAGFVVAGFAVHDAQPNGLALGIAILSGLVAFALIVAMFGSAIRHRARRPAQPRQ